MARRQRDYGMDVVCLLGTTYGATLILDFLGHNDELWNLLRVEPLWVAITYYYSEIEGYQEYRCSWECRKDLEVESTKVAPIFRKETSRRKTWSKATKIQTWMLGLNKVKVDHNTIQIGTKCRQCGHGVHVATYSPFPWCPVCPDHKFRPLTPTMVLAAYADRWDIESYALEAAELFEIPMDDNYGLDVRDPLSVYQGWFCGRQCAKASTEWEHYRTYYAQRNPWMETSWVRLILPLDRSVPQFEPEPYSHLIQSLVHARVLNIRLEVRMHTVIDTIHNMRARMYQYLAKNADGDRLIKMRRREWEHIPLSSVLYYSWLNKEEKKCLRYHMSRTAGPLEPIILLNIEYDMMNEEIMDDL